MTEGIQELKQLLSFPKEISIVTHRNPDGDAIGSSMGLAGYLQKLHHNVKVIFPSEYPTSYGFISGIQRAVIFDLDPNGARQIIEKSDVIFCLDFNGLDRVDKLGENIQFSKAKKVLIDHHLDPEPFTDIEFSDTSASSTCELVFKVIDELGDRSKIDPDVGECLFTGLITDTGSFRYGTRPYTYEVAASLKVLGVDDYKLADKIFNSQKEKHLRLLGHCLANRMEVMKDYGVGIMWLTRKDYADFDIQRGDTEGIVNYMLMMENIQVAAFILEQPSIIKISLRSKGDISVQEIAQKYFNGGGHKNAAGGGVYASLGDIKDKVRKVMPQYLTKLTV
ncbi:MAG: bifunctional oligoribonuclease/PAP phosphatase NrnA [Saprospiraceae bacterium]|nr:bifunctional oligoribonuclease/PAP phosphatase NrnA [Saprospiraceae bacterium]MBL0100891.1 bifunctional oligoribonuclease/PAP phosphatase NrnA [Saprospiraceae bacterium]